MVHSIRLTDNDSFTGGNHTSDNILIFQGLIQRQLSLG